MTEYRHIDKIVFAAVALCIAGLMMLSFAAGAADTGVDFSYEAGIFGKGLISVDITISEADYEDLLANALSETYYPCDVTIDGETVKSCGIRAKGNTSLSMVAQSGSERYSFKLSFDEYVSGQSFLGLDKLILNNNYADATMMKEALTYDMFAFLGADCSLYSFAKVYVNGEYRGLYLALEAVEESMMMRLYGTSFGELYKPDSMEFGGAGNMKNFDISDVRDRLGLDDGTASGEDPAGKGMEMPRGGGASSSAAGLNYLGDDPDSYSLIWDSEVFGTNDADHARVIEALKNISEGNDLEKYMNVDNLLRYLAVQTFTVNLDGLMGSMDHNYYLYEQDGRLNLIPWDYNLSFGGFQSSSASSVVNYPIDTPFENAESRRFFMALLENEEYLARYHEYLRLLAEEYVTGGGFESFLGSTLSLIDEPVKEDPTAFFDYDEFTAAAEMLRKVVSLRAESVLGQLGGSIPSTHASQQADSSALIDCSGIDLNVMGSMGGGRGGFGGNEGDRGFGDSGGRGFGDRGGAFPFGTEGTSPTGMTLTPTAADRMQPPGGGFPGIGGAPGGFPMPSGDQGAIPSMPSGDQGAMPSMPSGDQGAIPSMPSGDLGAMPSMPSGDLGAMPFGGIQQSSGGGTGSAVPGEISNLTLYIISFLLICAATIIAALYKRR